MANIIYDSEQKAIASLGIGAGETYHRGLPRYVWYNPHVVAFGKWIGGLLLLIGIFSGVFNIPNGATFENYGIGFIFLGIVVLVFGYFPNILFITCYIIGAAYVISDFAASGFTGSLLNGVFTAALGYVIKRTSFKIKKFTVRATGSKLEKELWVKIDRNHPEFKRGRYIRL